MLSNRTFIVKVIEIYKGHPCLWKTTDPDYHNKNKRNEAYERILQLFKTKDPNSTKDVVLKRINSMRGSFRKELNKIRSSEKSGAESAEVHVPKLWYFDLLHFLVDHDTPRASTSAASLTEDIPFGYDEGDIDDSEETESQVSSCSTSRPCTPEGSFQRPRSKADQVLDKIAKSIDRPPQIPFVKEKYASFGEHVAEKLRNMPPEMVSFSQKLISDVIFYGETKKLNMTSRIVTDYCVMPSSAVRQQHPVAPPNASVPSRSGNDQSHVTDKDVRNCWKNLRQEFGKQMRKNEIRPGEATPDDNGIQWPYFQRLLFLQDQFNAREKTSNFTDTSVELSPLSETINPVYIKSENSVHSDEEETMTPSHILSQSMVSFSCSDLEPTSRAATNSPTPSSSSPHTTPGYIVEKTGYKRRITAQSEIGKELEEEKTISYDRNDEDTCFFDSLLPHVKKLSPRDKLIFRMKVQQTLFELAFPAQPRTSFTEHEPHCVINEFDP